MGIQTVESKSVVLYDPSEINSRDCLGNTKLGDAIGRNAVHDVIFLINHGADVNLPARSENFLMSTPLQIAVETGNKRIVKILLKCKADVNATANKTTESGHSLSPLYLAARNGNKELVKLLLENGASDRKTLGLFVYIILLDSEILIDLFFRSTVDVNDRIPSFLPQENLTALGAAYQTNRLDVFIRLLNAGANVHYSTHGSSIDTSPLHLAVEKSWYSVVEILISKKANLNRHGVSGNTPLQKALNKNDKKMVARLIVAGAYIHPIASYPGDDLENALKKKGWNDLISKIPASAKRKPKPSKPHSSYQGNSYSSYSRWKNVFGNTGPNHSYQHNWSGNHYGTSNSAKTLFKHETWTKDLIVAKEAITDNGKGPTKNYVLYKKRIFKATEPHHLFGLEEGFTASELNKQYHTVLKKIHPDKVPEIFGNEANEMLKLYIETYHLLQMRFIEKK